MRFELKFGCYAIKSLFGREDSKRSLLSLLNAILDGNSVIESVKILNTVEIRAEISEYQPQKDVFDSKASRLDIDQFNWPIVRSAVVAEIDDGTIVNVGIVDSVCNSNITPQLQCANSADLDSRSIVYASSRRSGSL